MTICCGVHVWTSPENLKEVLNLKVQAATAFVRSVWAPDASLCCSPRLRKNRRRGVLAVSPRLPGRTVSRSRASWCSSSPAVPQEAHFQPEILACSEMNCFKALTYRQLFMPAADAGVKLEQAALLRSCCSVIPYPFIVVVAGNRRLCVLWAVRPWLLTYFICSLECSKMLYITFQGRDLQDCTKSAWEEGWVSKMPALQTRRAEFSPPGPT